MSGLDNLDAADALDQPQSKGLANLDAADKLGPTKTERFTTGLMDMPTGLGQIAEHVAETPLNWIRAGIRKGLNVAGAHDAADLFGDVSTKDFDRIVAQRENDYQQSRAAAQQNGIDWWRIGGNVANPLNYVGGGSASTVAGRIGQAALQGAALGTAQPSTSEGDFWLDKAKGAALGGAAGAVSAATIEGLTAGVKAGVRAIRGTPAAASSDAADTIVNETLKAAGNDPKTVDVSVLKGLRAEVQDALDKGVEPSETAIKNRALAESLPVPVPLTRGQATRDPLQYANEFNLKQIKGVGEPIATLENTQNRALIENLNIMGAKNAPDKVSAGATLAGHIQTFEDKLSGNITKAYDAVKNSQGHSAAMDGIAFHDAVKSALDEDWRFLPATVRSTIEDLGDGSLDLTVKRAQALDKAWSGLQSGAPLSSTEDRAISIAKRALLDAPVSDSVGEEAIAALRTAKGLAKQRFDLIDSVPAYKAVITGARSAEPENFFNKFVANGTSRELNELTKITGAVDPNAKELMGRTLLGEIKRNVINGSEENGIFSQAKFGNYMNDPVWQSRLSTLLPPELTSQLHNLSKVAEVVQRPPVASVPNRSGTAAAGINALQAGVGEKLSSFMAKFPVAAKTFKTMAEQRAEDRLREGVETAVNPGVTTKALPRYSPQHAALLRGAAEAVTPAALLYGKEQTQ